jgi:hypothetical protein
MTIRRVLAIALIGAAFLAVNVVPASAAQVRFAVRPYVYSGPYYYRPYYAYGYWGPRPYYPGYRYYLPPVAPTGDVKIDTHLKGASIYVDGGFAGDTGKLKKLPLSPGNHDIEVRGAGGSTLYHDRVQVLAGKTTEIKIAG